MRPWVVLPALGLLAACAAERTQEPTPTPTATVAAPRTLVAADFDPASLGARIAAPEDDATWAIMAGDVEIGVVKSYVACPKGMTTCDPKTLPAGTVLNYVYTITPGYPDAAAKPSPTSTATSAAGTKEVPAAVFEMMRPAPGFQGALGYAKAEASAALGADEAIAVSVDNGHLIWRVTGGTGWKSGMPITLWWQTTAPPAGPQDAFSFQWDGTTASATAPFPADKPVDPAPAR